MQQEQRYKVVSKLAAGGMAEVFRGESAGIEGFCKQVAIKRVLPHLSQNRDFIDMFLDEARLGAYLSHSRCVQVFDIGQSAGAHFIVMEFVDGADLKGVLDYLATQRRLMPVELACLITQQICEGLSYAHSATDHEGNPLNIVHRDISPHNVLMTRHGEVKLVDFGLAKASSHLTDEDEDVVKGKFGYLAPEVTLGKGADHRVDIFAAGILLWEMLAGRRLFHGKNDLETFKQVQSCQVPDPRQYRQDIPDPLMRVLLAALTRDADQRYQNADDFARALSDVAMRSVPPATYIDIGALVREAAAAKARDKEKDRRSEDRQSTVEVMGDLILEALHDFSSVMDEAIDDRLSLGTRGVEAKTGDFVDPTAWGFDEDFGGILDGPAGAAPAPGAASASPRGSAPAHGPVEPRELAGPPSGPTIEVTEAVSLVPELSEADLVSIAPGMGSERSAHPPPPPRRQQPPQAAPAQPASARPPSTAPSRRPPPGASAAERARGGHEAEEPEAKRRWWKLW